MKYIDLIAYPIMIAAVYVLFGLVNWNHDPASWTQPARCVWIVWGLAWGWALQNRIIRGGRG